jgi:hypothetical protein
MILYVTMMKQFHSMTLVVRKQHYKPRDNVSLPNQETQHITSQATHFLLIVAQIQILKTQNHCQHTELHGPFFGFSLSVHKNTVEANNSIFLHQGPKFPCSCLENSCPNFLIKLKELNNSKKC